MILLRQQQLKGQASTNQTCIGLKTRQCRCKCKAWPQPDSPAARLRSTQCIRLSQERIAAIIPCTSASSLVWRSSCSRRLCHSPTTSGSACRRGCRRGVPAVLRLLRRQPLAPAQQAGGHVGVAGGALGRGSQCQAHAAGTAGAKLARGGSSAAQFKRHRMPGWSVEAMVKAGWAPRCHMPMPLRCGAAVPAAGWAWAWRQHISALCYF